MNIELAYGEKGLTVDIPEKNLARVLKMKQQPVLENPVQAIQDVLQHPCGSDSLAQLARDRSSACIVISDVTRPVPNSVILPPLLETLEQNGIHRRDIVILIATGIHRPNQKEELRQLVGAEIADNYRIVNHFSRMDQDHRNLGKTRRGTDVLIDSTYVKSDLKILTGLIEPHLMAGFSGGRKSVCPGIASLKTVKVMHSPQILEHPNCREGVIKDNPFHEEALEIAQMAGVDFILNVTLNEEKKITGVFGGDLDKAHLQGVEFARQSLGDTLPEPADIVVTTSAGYPLDATFYQAVKGLTAALPVIRENGIIIIAAECREGIGSPEFTELVCNCDDVEQFMKDIYKEDYFVVDQWQFEEYVKVLRKARVFLCSDGIKDQYLNSLPVTPVESVEQGLERALSELGPDSRIAVIPKGPYVLCSIK